MGPRHDSLSSPVWLCTATQWLHLEVLIRGDLLQVPNKLGRLTGLRELSFQHKLVKSIPEPVLQLTALEALAITFCKLQRLPATLGAMHRLRSLNLQGNPWLQARLPAPVLCLWVSSGHPLCLLSALLGSHMARIKDLSPMVLCGIAVSTGEAFPSGMHISVTRQRHMKH